LYNSNFFFFFFFLLSIIGFIFLHAGLKFSIVDLKKKLLELCKSCAKNIIIIFLENVRFTTSIQQLYNNLSHEGGSYILESTLMWGVVVQLLYWCCTRIKSLIFYGPEIMTTRKKKKSKCWDLIWVAAVGWSNHSNLFVWVIHLKWTIEIMTTRQKR
jgi:hypothetical protein